MAPIIGEGYKFILFSVIFAVLVGYAINIYFAIPFLILAMYFAYFFRNPKREINSDKDVILSPADGTVKDIVEVDNDDFVGEDCHKIVIFMSVFDVHVNRSPIDGEIKCQKYVCGRFRPAYKEAVGFENEHHLIGIENNRIRITVTQIAGILARRIVSWVTLDDKLKQGELYGMIRFGSCLEIVVPSTVKINVKAGDKVYGGKTILGRIVD